MGSSGGGGTSTTQAEHSPEMRALQQAALPQIQSMLRLNPLSNYASWSPRQIAGSNPAYEQLFGYAPQLAANTQGYNILFGQGNTGGGGGSVFPEGLALPNMGGGTASASGGAVTPPPQFAAPDIQQIIQEQIASQVNPAVQQVVAANSPPSMAQQLLMAGQPWSTDTGLMNSANPYGYAIPGYNY